MITDYSQVQTLYSRGHEIASHSITYALNLIFADNFLPILCFFRHSFGERFTKQQWDREIVGQREILHLYGGVNRADIRGMRAPFLQGGGNRQFEMLHAENFTYDSSMPVFENQPPFWPYTLDYAINHECMIAPCPTKSFPGTQFITGVFTLFSLCMSFRFMGNWLGHVARPTGRSLLNG